MGRVEQLTNGSTSSKKIGGPEYFTGGKTSFTYEALAFAPIDASPDTIKDSLSLKLRTDTQARTVLTILKKRYVLQALLETSPEKLQLKRADELAETNAECDRRFEGMLTMADGYAYNHILTTLRTVKQLERSYRNNGEKLPFSAVDDALAEILAQPVPVAATETPSSEPPATLATLAEIWSDGNFPAPGATRRRSNQ